MLKKKITKTSKQKNKKYFKCVFSFSALFSLYLYFLLSLISSFCFYSNSSAFIWNMLFIFAVFFITSLLLFLLRFSKNKTIFCALEILTSTLIIALWLGYRSFFICINVFLAPSTYIYYLLFFYFT